MYQSVRASVFVNVPVSSCLEDDFYGLHVHSSTTYPRTDKTMTYGGRIAGFLPEGKFSGSGFDDTGHPLDRNKRESPGTCTLEYDFCEYCVHCRWMLPGPGLFSVNETKPDCYTTPMASIPYIVTGQSYPSHMAPIASIVSTHAKPHGLKI